jgi:hypothetical protein
MSNTTHFFGKASGTTALAEAVYGKSGGAALPAKLVYVQNGGAARLVYSTPSVGMTGTGSVTGAGASSSGTVSSTGGAPAATPGGNNSGSFGYSYAYVSGDTGFSITAGGATATPAFSHSFSGVANGTTSSGVSATWACTITDTVTGATAAANFAVGPFAWQNTIPAFTNPVVSASDVSDTIFGFGSAFGTASGTTSVSISGTTSGSFSYSWSRTTASEGISINNAALENPTWSCAVSQGGVGTDVHQETWQIVVTDTVSGLTGSTTINVYLAAEVDND